MMSDFNPTVDHAAAPPGPRAVNDARVVRAVIALYQLSLRQQVRGRRWIGMLILSLLPMLIAVIIRSSDPFASPKGMEFGLILMLIPQGLLPLLALVYASGIVQDEQEDQTLTYLLIRPIPKWLIFLVKWVAALTAAEILSFMSISLTYAAIFYHARGATSSAGQIVACCLGACAVHGLAVLAYCGIFGLMGLVTRRTLVVGMLYIALFEGLFANVGFNLREITVIYYARLLIYRLLPSTAVSQYRLHSAAAQTWNLVTAGGLMLKAYPPDWVCISVLLTTSILTALTAAWIFNHREFYVKTPVKTP